MKQVRWLAYRFRLDVRAFSRLDYHLILDQAPLLYLVGLAALVAVLLFGQHHSGQALDPIPVLVSLFRCQKWLTCYNLVWHASSEVRSDQL